MPEELPESLTERQLTIGYWLTVHRLWLRNLGVVILAVITGLVWFSNFSKLTDWALLGGAKERAEVAGLRNNKVDFASFISRNRPQQLAMLPPFELRAGDTSDFLAEVQNANTKWAAELTYAFVAGSLETKPQTDVVLPGDTRLLVAYANTSTDQPSFKMISQKWIRIPPHDIANFATWSADRLNFAVSEAVNAQVPVNNETITRTSFIVTNKSAFGYKEVPFEVALLRGNDVVAIQQVTVDRFPPNTTRLVEATWFYDVPLTSTVRVRPLLNLLDSEVYLKEAPGAPTDIREQLPQ